MHELLGWSGPRSLRQFVTLLDWREEHHNVPEPLHYYLMQIACEARRVLAKKPGKIKMEHFQLQFGRSRKKGQENLSREEVAKRSMKRWLGFMTVKPVVESKE